MSKKEDRLYINEKDRETYTMLEKEKSSFLYGRSNKELFLMAMIYGIMNNRKNKKFEKRFGFVRAEYLNDEDNSNSIINAVAIKETNSLDVLLNKQEVYRIAEEYANGGLPYLKKDVFSKKEGRYVKRLEERLVDVHSKIKLNL